MPTCDYCFKDLTGEADAILKPCNHRIHLKCEGKDGECPTCKMQKEFSAYGQWALVFLLGALLGIVSMWMVGSASNIMQELKTDTIRSVVYDVQRDLRTLETRAEQSLSARVLVYSALKDIKALVRKELNKLEAAQRSI
jgi:hypothetical protein